MSPIPTSAASSTGRGRPRGFDTDDVIEKVTELFWDRGFEATGVADIATATGLNKSSLYSTFGSKEEIFVEALKHYGEDQARQLAAVLESGHAGLDDLLAVFAARRATLETPNGPSGCLMVNSSCELGDRDDTVSQLTATFRNDIRTAVRSALSRAADAGEIDPDMIDTYLEVVVNFIHGLAVITRSGADETELLAQYDAVERTIKSWRR